MNRSRSNAQLATVVGAIIAIKASFGLRAAPIDIAMDSGNSSSWLTCSMKACHL
jgi:hypothetical protein